MPTLTERINTAVSTLETGVTNLLTAIATCLGYRDDAAASATAAALSATSAAGGAGAWTEKNSNFTAAANGKYEVTANATVTDPSPVQGLIYTVFVRAGTTTVGGVNYPNPGTLITRSYNSGAWASHYTDSRADMPRLEGRHRLTDFFKALYSFTQAPTSYRFGVGFYGDSVSQHVPGELVKMLTVSFPRAEISGPSVLQATLTRSAQTANLFTYDGEIAVIGDQSLYNGLQPVVSITRSGSTATVTTAYDHGFTTGRYATIAGAAQSEYNGFFQVTRLSATQFTYTVSGTPATPATGTITSYGAQADFTYLPSADHIDIQDTGYLEWDYGQSQGASEVNMFLATGPGMGSALVELFNRDTSALVTSTTQSLSAGSVGAVKVAFTGISKSLKYKIRVTATGRVVHLRTLFLKASGMVPVTLGRGGSTLTQNNYANSTIFTYLCTQLNIALLTLQCKEENHTVSFPLTMTRLGLATSASKLVVGSLPDSTSEANQVAINASLRSYALNSGYAYFDGFSAIGSYSELTRLSWISDGTHPLEPANRHVAGLIYAELSAMRLFQTDIRENVNHRGIAGTIATTIYRMFRGDGDETTFDWALSAGGGDPGRVHLQNIRFLKFGSSGNYSGLLGYGTYGVQISNELEQPAFLRALNFEMTSTSSPSELNADLRFKADGAGLQFKEGGAGAKMGTAILVGGTVTVNTTAAIANARIFAFCQTPGGTPGFLRVSSRVNGTSFTITSSSGTDTSTIAWLIIFPSP